MGCSCNKKITRTNATTKRQVVRQRTIAKSARTTNQSGKVIHRMLERF